MKGFKTAWVMNVMSEKIKDNVVKEINKNFSTIHLSGNLARTIWCEDIMRQKWTTFANSDFSRGRKVAVVHIPAVRYDIAKYRKEGVIEHHPEKGSYACEVNVSGGFSRYHVGYVDNAIIKSISRALSSVRKSVGSSVELKSIIIR